MSLSFYDCSVAAYLQVLGGVKTAMAKAVAHSEETGLDLQSVVDFRLHEDMLPFSFQVISVWHHSLGALKGLQAGVFEPPPALDPLDFSGLQGLVDEAMAYCTAPTPEAVNALAEGPMVFRIRGREMPFTTDNFLLSFSLPNVYFHATTTYSILRHLGVPLGKIDYLGQLRLGS